MTNNHKMLNLEAKSIWSTILLPSVPLSQSKDSCYRTELIIFITALNEVLLLILPQQEGLPHVIRSNIIVAVIENESTPTDQSDSRICLIGTFNDLKNC